MDFTGNGVVQAKTKSTYGYHQFNNIYANRDIDWKHVEFLKEAISQKNLLHLFPIIVDDKLNIIDGQHRLLAAQALDEAIHYVVDKGCNVLDISSINSAQKKWQLSDYITFYSKRDNLNYIHLHKLINITKEGVYTLLRLDEGQPSNNVTKYIESGNLKLDANSFHSIKNKYELINKTWTQFHDNKVKRGFIFAMNRLISYPEYKHSRMISKLNKKAKLLKGCATTGEYLDALLEIYNYKCSKSLLKLK